MRGAKRFAAWAIWQLFVLVLAFIVWANLFSEYGTYTDPRTSNVAALVFLVVAVYVGTIVPMRRWRVWNRHEKGDHEREAEDWRSRAMNVRLAKGLMSITIKPQTADDAERLTRAFERLTAEDPQLSVVTDSRDRQIELRGMSEEHLEVAIDRLKREFGVNAMLDRPKVVYREALTRPADGEAKHAKQTGGRGEYGHVKLRIQPREPGEGALIENKLAGGQIPERFIDAVKLGIADALERGPLGGYPIEDVCVEIADGSYHDVDSSEVAFRLAGALATQRALENAGSVLLEPVMRVEVTAPADYEEEIVATLIARRGLPQPYETRGGMRVIRALVPLARLFGYRTELRGKTYGHGSYTAEFHACVPCETAGDDEPDSRVREPRHPTPNPRDSAIALPEPDDQYLSRTSATNRVQNRECTTPTQPRVGEDPILQRLGEKACGAALLLSACEGVTSTR